jgi:hypothetical protein
LSAFLVFHQGTHYELRFYDGPMAETITPMCSWDRPGQPPSGAETDIPDLSGVTDPDEDKK